MNARCESCESYDDGGGDARLPFGPDFDWLGLLVRRTILREAAVRICAQGKEP
jgi:hypothetical protein